MTRTLTPKQFRVRVSDGYLSGTAVAKMLFFDPDQCVVEIGDDGHMVLRQEDKILELHFTSKVFLEKVPSDE